MKNLQSYEEFLNEAIEIISMTDAGTSNRGKGDTTLKHNEIIDVLSDPETWTDDISFKDKSGNVYFIDDLIDKEVKVGSKKLTIIEESLNESTYSRTYEINHKVGDEIDLPVVGKCKVVEVGIKPKKIYKNPWVCTGKDFLAFEPQKVFLKTTHKPESIGANAIRLETMDSYKDPILMYQYQENNKVYTQYAYMN